MTQDRWFRRDSRLLAVFISPFDRVWSSKAIALLVACVDYLSTDAFAGAFALSIVSGVVDYRTGVRAANLADQKFDPVIAQRAWLAKITGWTLSFLIRALEFYARGQGFDTHGALATAVALSLFAVDLQTTSHYREQMGAAPIPVLGRVLKWIQDWIGSKLPPSPPAAAPTTGDGQ